MRQPSVGIPADITRLTGITDDMVAGQAIDMSALATLVEPADIVIAHNLKARGYRWSDGSDGRPKSWWVEIDEHDLADELHYLRTEIYRWPDADPLVRRLTAHDRFKA